MKPTCIDLKTFHLAAIFLKEHFKEPTSLVWGLLSPCLVFYGLNLSNIGNSIYMPLAKWYYAYIALNVAFFGFSLYLIGRRESGFIRSFVYTLPQRRRFLLAHTLSYTVISTLYCTGFYLITKPFFGSYDIWELTSLLWKFYTCFLAFSAIGTLFVLLPINFQTAGTIFSILSFSMIMTGMILTRQSSEIQQTTSSFNPLLHAGDLIDGAPALTPTVITSLLVVSASVLLMKFFRVNPVWNRY